MTVSYLYEDLPVKIDSVEVQDIMGINLEDEILGDNSNRITYFLDAVHRQVYDFLIYVTGNREYKDALITGYSDKLTKPIKKALFAQVDYLLNNDNIELFNGVIKTVNGAEYKDTMETASKIIAPSVINILMATKPNVLYAGE